MSILPNQSVQSSTNAAYASNFARGERRFGRVNWLGLATLCRREVQRFLNVYTQTLLAPVATAILFLIVFTLALGATRGEVEGAPFSVFLAPGVVMMTVIQNAFANTSSSIMIAKVQGSIYDTLTPPLSAGELTFGVVFGGAARGAMVAALASLCVLPVLGVGVAHPLWAVFFTIVGATMLALIGVLAGVWAIKFDQLAAVTNFIVTPLSFLSGTFYVSDALAEPWRTALKFNPFHYLIDGFRYAVIDHPSAENPWLGALVCLGVVAVLWTVCWRMFARGYRLKS